MRKLTSKHFSLAAAILLVTAVGCKKDDAKTEPAPKVTPDTPSKTTPTTPAKTAVPITSKAPGAVAMLREGRALQEGFRFADATSKYKKAIELDPDFALGHAQLAFLTKGEAGLEHRKRAQELAAKLPEAERLLIESMVAESSDARAKALKALAAKVPNDWEVQIMVARHALKNGETDAARTAFEKAAELNPSAPYPHNNLAYIYAESGDFKAAVESVTKYAKLSPGEPNPLDSKGEILLMAGKFSESEAAFSEALEISADFAIAHEGIAATKFYRGDWDGGIKELQVASKKANRAIDRYELQSKLGWALVAAGKDKQAKEAFAAASSSASEAGMGKRAGAEQILTAEILIKKGDYTAARAKAQKALAAMKADEVPAKKQHWARTLETIAAARSGDIAGAEKSLASLVADANGSHYVSLAASHVALIKGDAEGAIKAASKLENNKWFSGRAGLLTAEALQKAGKAEKAKEVRRELSTRYRRDIHSVMLAEEAKKAGEG